MLSSKYNGYDVHLIESIDELDYIRSLLNGNSNVVGIDTETSGLDVHDNIAGVCVSCGTSYKRGDYHGFYLPVRHTTRECNLPLDKVIQFTQELVDTRTTFWFNRNFDANMLERDGLVFPQFAKGTHDVQIMCHLAHSEPMPGLKTWTKKELGFDVLSFESNNAKDHNFKTTDPRISYIYASQDPLVTTLLGLHVWNKYKHVQKIYPLDNQFADVLRRIIWSTDMYIDKDDLQRLLNENLKELSLVRMQIFNLCGYQFNIGSARDKADALSRFVTLTEKTASGAYAVGADVLETIDHPLAHLLLKYSELEKLRGTYLQKMCDFPVPFHVNYTHCNVATGRMSSGGADGNSFFAPLNIQNIPKIEVLKYLHLSPTTSSFGWTLDTSPYAPLSGNITLTTDQGELPIKDITKGMKVLSRGHEYEVLKCGELQTTLLPNEGVYCKRKSDESWVVMPTGTGTPYYIDLGEGVYAVEASGGRVEVQIHAIHKMKCKGGLREAFTCPEGYVWVSADYCISPDSLIDTPRGKIPMRSLKDGDLVLTPQGVKRCINPHYTGKKQVIRITLDTGEVLECSPEHKIAVNRNGSVVWVLAKDLTTTDDIITHGQNTRHSTKDTCNQLGR